MPAGPIYFDCWISDIVFDGDVNWYSVCLSFSTRDTHTHTHTKNVFNLYYFNGFLCVREHVFVRVFAFFSAALFSLSGLFE